MLQRLHLKRIIHGNLKPSKFLVDLEHQSSENLYLNAFDKADMLNKDWTPEDSAEKRIKLRVKLDHHKFTSLSAHYGYRKWQYSLDNLLIVMLTALGFKDDLESLGYMIVYFLKRGTFALGSWLLRVHRQHDQQKEGRKNRQ